MIESLQAIFINTIKDNKDNPNLLIIIKEVTFELSHKKLQHLQNDTHVLGRAEKLLGLFVGMLEKEELKNSKTISAVIDGLMKAVTYEKEQNIYKLIYEKDKIEKAIEMQIYSMRELIKKSYFNVENAVEALDEQEKKEVLLNIQDAKLRSVEMFGLLKEALEEAYLKTIERGDDVENTIEEISKNFTYQAITEGHFVKQRIVNIISNILEVSIDMADTNIPFAKEILQGAVRGTKNGLYKATEKFKNDLKFAPEEIEMYMGRSLESSKKELLKIEESYVATLKQVSLTTVGISAEILGEIISVEDSSLARLKRIGFEAAETLAERFDVLKEEALVFEKEFMGKAGKKFGEMKKGASVKVEAFKIDATPKAKQAAEDAKALGARAWEVAKNMVDSAVKSTKDILNKDDKNEKK
ncbi:MAG: DUF6781 family protein [Campylobacteraceae bacterium]